MRMIMVKPGEGCRVQFEDRSWLTEENCPEDGKRVLLDIFVRRLIAAGDLVNVTPEAGVTDAAEDEPVAKVAQGDATASEPASTDAAATLAATIAASKARSEAMAQQDATTAEAAGDTPIPAEPAHQDPAAPEAGHEEHAQ